MKKTNNILVFWGLRGTREFCWEATFFCNQRYFWLGLFVFLFLFLPLLSVDFLKIGHLFDIDPDLPKGGTPNVFGLATCDI